MSHQVFLTSFCISRFPNKSVNSDFILVIVRDKLTDLLGSRLLQNDLKNSLCEISLGSALMYSNCPCALVFALLINSGFVGVPQEQKMLKGHLPRVMYHQVY